MVQIVTKDLNGGPFRQNCVKSLITTLADKNIITCLSWPETWILISEMEMTATLEFFILRSHFTLCHIEMPEKLKM